MNDFVENFSQLNLVLGFFVHHEKNMTSARVLAIDNWDDKAQALLQTHLDEP